MNRLLQSIVGARLAAGIACGVWLAALNPTARADEEAKKVIEAAVKAHGGAEKIAKNQNKAMILKSKLKVFANGMEFDATMEARSDGKHFRQDVSLSIMGQKIEQSVGFDGKEVWIAVNGKVVTSLSKKEDLDLVEEAMHAEKVGDLMFLNDKSVEISIIGDDKVGDIPVVGVRVSKKGRKDVSLFFDKKTHLLKKTESRGLSFQSRQEVTQERILDEYKEFDGRMRPTKAIMNQDGMKVVEMEFTGIEFVDSLDDSTFKKPD